MGSPTTTISDTNRVKQGKTTKDVAFIMGMST